ncbi:MAG: TRAP transporter substrate-binding protein [Acidimicrobiales bacterium]
MSKVRIAVGGYAPQQSVHSRAVDHFAAAVAEASGGEVEVDVLYNVMDRGRPATDLFDLVRSGELTWCYYSSSYLGPSVPALDAIEIPFMFDTVDRAHRALDGAFGSTLAEAVQSAEGFEVLGFWDNGLRHLTNAIRPIRTPADCHGLRIRLQPNPIHEALASAWGMIPVGAELSEGIAMIQRGEVDAQENPLANTVAYGVDHHHVTLSAHLYGARGLFANAEALVELGEVGDLVRAAARQAIDYQRDAALSYELELRRKLESAGREIIDLSDTERAAFADAAAEVIDDARAGVEPALLAMVDDRP